jgi:hypothetical protein
MNIQEATPIELTEQERSALEAMIRSPKTEHGIVERARIVLLAAAGRSTRSIADELATWPGRVSRWRTRFARERLGGLPDLSAAHAATVQLSMPAVVALGGVAFLAEPLSLRLLGSRLIKSTIR